MKLRIAYERSVNIFASGLAMVAQRLPFLKNLSPIFGTTGGMNFAAPLTVTFVGTHALSGQSITIFPADGETNPASATVGEEFVWSFRASSHRLRSVKTELEGVEGLPPGLTITGPSIGVFFLAGIPTEAGDFELKITGYRFANLTGDETAPYVLTLNVGSVEEPLDPFEEFVATFWSGDDLNDPLLVGPLSDPDSDGIQNVMEFLLDLDPTKAEAMPGTFGVDPDDVAKMRYEIPLNVAAGAVDVSFEESSNLETDWTTVPAENVTRTDSVIVLSVPIDGKKLYRLKVALSED